MVSTRKYILVGTYKENMYPSVCVEAIEKLGINYRIFIILKFKLFFNFFKLIILNKKIVEIKNFIYNKIYTNLKKKIIKIL
jgi:hypothetical protein